MKKFVIMSSGNIFSNTIKVLICTLFVNLALAEKVPQYQIDLENLPREQRESFYKHLVESKRLFSQQRIIEAIDVVKAADKLVPNYPALLSIEGACYVELRDFASAEKVFLKANTAAPNNSSILFNLGEINFVQSRWQKSKTFFKQVMQLMETDPTDTIYLLSEFKTYVADKKLGNDSAAKVIEDKYDFTFDSPAFYFINSVKEYEAGNKNESQVWLQKARAVFSKQGALDPWQDSLVESGYIKSFYGGGDRDEVDVKLKGGGTPDGAALNLTPIEE